ncbi:MAG: hypothetical protein RJA70_4678 [Pseudomonadota bacterium]|jgi:hypothetical protein
MLGRFLLASVLTGTVSLTACDSLRPAVSLWVRPHDKTPADASVSIDEEFVGLLGYVASRGVRLPEGEHRITIEREGYFPWDMMVISDREPISLDVRLVPIPD